MTDLVILPARVTAADGTPVSGALISVFDEGTTAPRAAFQDTSGTLAHPSTIVVDAAGKPPAIYTNGTTGVKVVVTDANGAALFTFDPAPRMALGASGADAVSFTPTTEIQATTVQDAIPEAATLASVSSDDASPGYLSTKLEEGAGIRLTESNGGANETLQIAVRLLDEDDFASDSALDAATQQSIKAYVDAATASTQWTYSAVSTTTGSVAIDFGGLPSGLVDIELIGTGISLTGTDDFLVQLGSSGVPQTTGYTSSAQFPISSNNVNGQSATNGALIQGNSGTPLANLMVRCTRFPSTNEWTVSHTVNTTALYVGTGLASVTLGGSLDILRFTASGADTFDGNNCFVRYR